MRSELDDSARLLLFLDLSHEEDDINGNLLIEYDLSSRFGVQSQNGSCCTIKTAMHNQNSDQRSYSGSWVHSPTMNRTYVPVYSVYSTASLTVRSILTTTSTTHHIILSVCSNHMCTCSVCTYVLIMFVCAT
jgi:hypothetical protein